MEGRFTSRRQRNGPVSRCAPGAIRLSDRVQVLEIPLFPGYVFARFDTRRMAPILRIPGVARAVGFGGKPAAIPASEIDGQAICTESS